MQLHALPAILEFLVTLVLNISSGVSFQYSYKGVDWTARIVYKELYKRHFSRDALFGIFELL